MPIAKRLPTRPLKVFSLLLMLACTAAVAEESRPELKTRQDSSVMVIKKTVRRVVVDVVVRDKDRKPVKGLAAKDFALSEDGKPQRVLSFEAHQFDSPSISMPANGPTLPPNVFVNVPSKPEHGPLYVILYDMVNMENEDQAYARAQVVKFISEKPEGARFAIYSHSDGLHLIQGFTEDKELLYAALDPKKPKPHMPRIFLMQGNFAGAHGMADPAVAMISVLTHIGETLDGIPGRKNLIWMAGDFPLAVFPRDGDPPEMLEDVRRMEDVLTRAQIAVYPVNVRGVVTNPEGALTGGGPHMSAGGDGPDVSPGAPPANQLNELDNTTLMARYHGSLSRAYGEQEEIAAATGGRAFYSDNELKTALSEAVDDGSYYYEISYSPTNPNYDGRLRNIQVKVEGGKYALEYRRSYFADDPDAVVLSRKAIKKGVDTDTLEEAMATQQERPMFASLQHGAPLIHQLIFKAKVYPVGVPYTATPEEMATLVRQPAYVRGRSRLGKNPKPVQVQKYAVYYAVVASQVKAQAGDPIPLEFAAVAFDNDGWLVNGLVEEVADDRSVNPFQGMQPDAASSGEAGGQKVYRAMQELEVPLTATSLRIAVRDTSTNRLGALEVALPLTSEPEVGASPSGSQQPGSNSFLPKPN